MSKQRCETCQFWEDMREQNAKDIAAYHTWAASGVLGEAHPFLGMGMPSVCPVGVCHRSPAEQVHGPFDWCGEWEASE